MVGRTTYVHGTRSVSQALTDWPALVLGRKVPEQLSFESLAARSNRVVGHSLGAAWAKSYASAHPGVSYTGFGRPGFGHVQGDHANLGDPIAFFQFHPTSWKLGHGLSSYG